jgi:hypothetical protein
MRRLRPCLENGFLELDINTAERSLGPIALGRKNYLFMGSERGGKSAAIATTPIETAKVSGHLVGGPSYRISTAPDRRRHPLSQREIA